MKSDFNPKTDFVKCYKELTADLRPWFAIWLVTRKIYDVRDHLRDCGYDTFLPEQQIWYVRDGKRQYRMRPVMIYVLYIKCKDDTMKRVDDEAIYAFRELFRHTPYRVSIVRTFPDSNKVAKISAMDMREFMMLCNPEYTQKYFVSLEEARTFKPGTKVIITHGPLKGFTGTLVRKHKHYFLLRTAPGIGVMLQVSRWTCQPL